MEKPQQAQQKEKLRLAVLFGGRACEHDVSVVSALQCMDAIDPARYEVIPVYVARDGAWYTGAPLRSLESVRHFNPAAPGIVRVYPDVTAGSAALLYIRRKKGLLGGDNLAIAARMDVAMPVFHGMHGEDGAVQGLLELMNVPYTSSGLVGSAVGMDKLAMRSLFRGCGFPVLDAVGFTRGEWEREEAAVLARIESALAYPLFVKPANLGSSIGISRAEDQAALREAIAVALSYDRRVLVEPAVKAPREVNCAVLGFDAEVRASVCEMPVSWEAFLSFEEKYLRGGKGGKGAGGKAGGMETLGRKIPAPIGEEMTARIRSLAVDVFRALDCKGVVRIDFLLDGNTVYVNEINTIPGSLAFYLWEPTGMPYAKLIDELVALALRAQAEKNRSVFAFDSNLLNQCVLGAKGAKQ